MEGLVILLAEFVAALAVLMVVGAELVAALLGFLVQLIWWLLERRTDGDGPKWSRHLNARQKQSLRHAGRIIQRAVLGLLAVTLIAIVLVNFVFLEATVAFVARRVEARTGIAIRYDSMQGNLFTGSFDFTGLHLVQETDDTARFDVHVAKVGTRFSVWDLIRARKVMESVEINGVTGDFVRLAKGSTEDDAVIFTSRSVAVRLPGPRTRRSFVIGRLSVTDGRLQVRDQTQPAAITYPVQIRTITAQPMRSYFMWFDLLYRSNMDLSVDGTGVVVENRTEGDQRHTVWSITDIKAPVLASMVGGPFALFSEGRIDLVAKDTWTITDDAEITMDWVMRMRDVRAVMPPNTPAQLRPPAMVFVNHVNARTEPWEVGFTLTLREAQFAGAATLDARQIWAGATEALLKETVGLDDAQIGTLKERARSGLNKLEEFLKKRDEKRATGSTPATE